MNSRYRLALAMGQDKFEKVVREDEELMQEFGLRLLSVEGGMSAALESEVKGGKVHPWHVVEISSKTWGWLRPLLLELREARQTAMAALPLAAN